MEILWQISMQNSSFGGELTTEIVVLPVSHDHQKINFKFSKMSMQE